MNKIGAASTLALLFLTGLAQAKDWDVRGYGQVVYTDGAVKPLKGAHITLLDIDVDFDDEIASGYTATDGRFDLSGRGGDPKFPFICDDNCSKPDPAVEVELENSLITVETELGFNWHATTPEHSNTAGTINFGTFQFASTDGRHAETLFARSLYQYEQVRSWLNSPGFLLPRHNGHMNVLFPAVLAAGVPWTTEESIHWPGSFTDFDAVYHEFGHRLRHAADGDFFHFLSDVARYSYMQQHVATKRTNTGFAFNEGWAEYFSTFLDAGERTTFSNWTTVTGGDEVEGNVAAKLKALSDLCGFPVMWETLRSNTIHSFAEFDRAIRARNSGRGQCLAPRHVVVLPLRTAVFVKQVAAAPGAPQAANLALADRMDRNAGRIQTSRKYIQVAKTGNTAGHQVVVRVVDRRIKAFQSWESAIRAAYRRNVDALKPLSEANTKDGSARTERRNAKASFVRAAVEPRLTQIADLRRSLDTERAATKDPAIHAYLDALKGRYDRAEIALRASLATASTDSPSIPARLLPRSVSDLAQ